MSRTSPFITPCSPMFSKVPPIGPLWVHEVKFDGYRLQIHKVGKHVVLYSKRGNDLTSSYPTLVRAVTKLPTKAVILDAELTICAPDGSPDFSALLRRKTDGLRVWVFDILSQSGKDQRLKPLGTRRAKLKTLMGRVESQLIGYSEAFSEPVPLLAACAARGMEGIVSKRLDRPYRSGPSKEWLKTKCPQWREENSWRHEFFQRR